MRTSASGRLVAVLLAGLVALLLQVTVLPHFAWQVGGRSIVPDLVLLVVVAVALITDTRYALLVGFFAGLVLDLAPPADHTAGRWAFALAVVGYVIGRLAHDHTAEADPITSSGPRRPPLPLILAAAAGGSFIGTSAFALTGLLLSEGAGGVGDLLLVALSALLLDVVAALIVVPAMWWLLRRIGTERGTANLWARA